jgi:hypothetical protein
VTAPEPEPAPGAPPGEAPTIDPVDQLVLPPLRPRTAWYVVGVSVIVLGLAAAFGLLTVGAFGYLRDIDDFARLDAPGHTSARLDAGTNRVYHEPRGRALASLEDLGLVVEDPDGAPVEVRPPASSEHYQVERRSGTAVGEFVAPASGTYEITAAGEAPGRLAVGPSPRPRLRLLGQAAVAVALVSVATGVTVLVVTRRRRRRAQAARLEQQQVRRVERLA